MHAEQIIIIFPIFFILFFALCIWYCFQLYYTEEYTVVTVYNDNVFLYNYLLQMHQIIHLSPVGCFTIARGKTVQKNHEVSWVNDRISVWKPRGHWFEFAVASKVFSYVIVIEKRIYFYIYTAAFNLTIITVIYKYNSYYRYK